MAELITCGHSLAVLIETNISDESTAQNWSFIYDIITNVDINMSNEPHAHPIPYGTEITDHVKRGMDRITITGLVSCYGCGNKTNSTFDVIPALKRLSERMMYCKDDFVLLTSNNWQARYMILTSVSISENYETSQQKEITTEWVGANLTGNISSPDFKRGGIIY